jgi:hypothetical protein
VDLVAAWLAFPAVLLALAAGWGLLLEALAGRALPGPLVLPAGFAALVVVLQVPASAGGTARLATPLAAAGAVAGVALWAGQSTRLPRPDLAAGATALGVFVAYAAPVVLSGEPAIAGYIRLDDSATWIALADHVLAEGRDVSSLGASTHDVLLRLLDSGDYPIGALLPFAIGGMLVDQDLAWLLQPYLGVLAVLLALALDVVLVPAIERRWLRAGVAFLAAGAALLYGYALWGGVKELATAALLATVAAAGAQLGGAVPRGTVARLREVLVLAVACAAVLGSVSVGGVVWLAPVLAALGVFVVRLRAWPEALRVLAALAAVALVCSIVPLTGAGFTRGLVNTPAAASERLGNLREPLSPLQVLGVWPVGDFRLHPSAGAATAVLLVVLVPAAVLGAAVLVARRLWGVLGYAGGVLVGAGLVAAYAWPWIDAKAYAIASPAPVVLAGIAVAAMLEVGRRWFGLVVAFVVVVGVTWSDALAYHDVALTPHDRHAELARIGQRFAGEGPTLMTEYDPYGPRWFLRRMDAEGAGELRNRVVPLVGGEYLGKGQSADVDAFAYTGLSEYRTLVLRRSPVASRPPSSYRLVWRGRWYEVWQRDQAAPPVRVHMALGSALDPGDLPRCADVLALARAARPAGALLAAVAREPVVVPLGSTAELPSAGRWEVWLGGAPRTTTEVKIDGVPAGRTGPELSYPGQWVPTGVATLSAGPHAIQVQVSGAGLRPGAGNSDEFSIGPAALVRADVDGGLLRVEPKDARALCGQRLDWIEAVG